MGILKGELDGFVGMWDRRVWGQIHNRPEWEYSDIETEWDYFWQFYEKRNWSDSFHLGDKDLTGNPPCGQIDIVPAEACLEAWSRYKTLMFLGWNTMTPELYEKMKQYVANGGQLIISLSHLRTNIKRLEPMKLFRDGDLLDLGAGCDVVQKSGAWLNYGDLRLGQGRENAKKYLADNKELCEEIKAKILVAKGMVDGSD